MSRLLLKDFRKDPPSSQFGSIQKLSILIILAGDADKSLAAGMSDHVTKPIDPDPLFATLQKWIQPDKKRVRAEQPEASGAAEVITESVPGAQK